MPYVRGHYRKSSRGSAGAGGCLLAIPIAIIGAIGVVLTAIAAAFRGASSWVSDNRAPVIAAILVVIAVVVSIGVSSARIKKQRRERLEQYWSGAVTLAQDKHASMVHASKVIDARKGVDVVPPEFAAEFEKLYRQAVAEVVSDRKVDETERKRLDAIKRGLEIPGDAARRAEIEGYLQAHAAMVGDGRLTEQEEVLLTDLLEALRVPPGAVRAQLARAAELRKAREVGASALLPIETDVKLKKGEACYHTAPFVEKKKRVTRTYQENGVRYSDTELEAYRDGTLYVTNHRVLLVAEGTTNIRFSSVLDTAVDPDEGVVALTVDGRKTPYYLSVSEPFVTLAYIDKATNAVAG